MKLRLFPQSLRWQVQVWHGALLFVVLAAFGGTAFWFVHENQMKRVDIELQPRLASLVQRVKFAAGAKEFRRGPMMGSPNAMFGSAPSFFQPSSTDGRWFASQRTGFDATIGAGFYGIVWSADGRVFYRSTNAPTDAAGLMPERRSTGEIQVAPEPTPASNASPTSAPSAGFQPSFRQMPRFLPEVPVRASIVSGEARLRGDFRELIWADADGYRVVVGRCINAELADLRRLAWLFAGVGAAILLLGLMIGWWLSAQAIRPIKDIVATARKITHGNLSERISPASARSELGELAQVLNETFARLQSAFIRQSRFAADASHELRTPAFIILSQAQSALKRPRSPEEYREGFEVCQRAARQMGQIIESLLILARQDAGEINHRPEPCSLDHIAADAVGLLRGFAAERRVRLHADLQPAPVIGDQHQLRQLLINLLNNAVEYNRPGGEVWVAVARHGDEAWLTVTDNGPGISPADLPHVFERFFRASRSRQLTDGHTGLGLAICKAIAEAHAGHIAAQSEPGKGAVFTVRLPASNP